jgi:hypothetical protein
MSVRVPTVAATALLLALFTTAAAPAAKPPSSGSAPKNLRITATTSSSATLAWDAASGATGYSVHNMTTWKFYQVPATQTTFTETRLTPLVTHRWVVYAIKSGNTSGTSNMVSYTTPADTTPPSAPALSATYVGPKAVMLDWTDSVDDTSNVRYTVEIDGARWATIDDSKATITGLSPSTSYAFTVVASDRSGNTARSNAPTVTTPAADNTSPPTAPTISAASFDGACEVWVSWTAASDDVDPPDVIVYHLSLNGQLVTSQVGQTTSIEYVPHAGTHTFTVVAVDSSGNRSETSNQATVDTPAC